MKLALLILAASGRRPARLAQPDLRRSAPRRRGSRSSASARSAPSEPSARTSSICRTPAATGIAPSSAAPAPTSSERSASASIRASARRSTTARRCSSTASAARSTRWCAARAAPPPAQLTSGRRYFFDLSSSIAGPPLAQPGLDRLAEEGERRRQQHGDPDQALLDVDRGLDLLAEHADVELQPVALPGRATPARRPADGRSGCPYCRRSAASPPRRRGGAAGRR